MANRLVHHWEIPPGFTSTTAVYRGRNPELAELRGKTIPLEDVEKLVPVGEREAVEVPDPKGGFFFPWKHASIVEYDEANNVVSYSA